MADVVNGLELLLQEVPETLIGKLPKVTCVECRKKENRGECKGHRKRKCEECSGWLTPAHMHLDYVGHAETTSRLLEADLEWNWEPLAFGPDGLPAFDADGGLWIRLTVCGVTRLGYGTAENANGFKARGDLRKEIIGDALRNAAMRFGWALNLWAKTDIHERAPQEEPQHEVADAVARKAQQERRAESAAPDTGASGEHAAAPTKTKPSTNAQRVKLVLLVAEKLGIIDDRDARLAAYSSFVGRPVASGNELTSTEAHRMIDDLSKRPDVPRPEREPVAAAPNPRNGDGPPLSPESAAAFDKAYAATETPPGSDEGSWSHRQLADRGTPLPPPGWTREQGDHLAADFLTELNSASNDKECDEIAGRIASAVKAGKISSEDRGTLLAIYNGQKQDRARVKATT